LFIWWLDTAGLRKHLPNIINDVFSQKKIIFICLRAGPPPPKHSRNFCTVQTETGLLEIRSKKKKKKTGVKVTKRLNMLREALKNHDQSRQRGERCRRAAPKPIVRSNSSGEKLLQE